MNKSKVKNNAGVTLIELVVVLAVFMFIIGATVSIFITIVQRQKSVLEEQDLINQTNYFMEYISKITRTAVRDEAGDCLNVDEVSYPNYIYLLTHYNAMEGFYQGIKFITDDNVCEEIYVDQDGILKEVKESNPAQNMLSDKFNIEHASFVINGDKSLQGASANDQIQPRITILLNIQAQISGTWQEKIVQTTISQRNLIIEE